MISADRTTVTFQPDAGMKSIKHPFWKPNKHDGTRVYIYGSDLSSLKTGQYSIKAHVACGTDITDLSCLADPSVAEGVSLTPEAATVADCATTNAPTTLAPTTGAPTTGAPTTGAPTTGAPTTDAPTTTPTGTALPPTTPTPTCQFTGTHNGGSNPNWWQSGNSYEYQAYINIPITAPITGGWYVDLHFQNPVQSMQFWSGQAEKVDNQGFHWRLIGWCNQTWNNNIDLTYIGRTNTSGINSLVGFSCSLLLTEYLLSTSSSKNENLL